MKTLSIVIRSPEGLHAKPASELFMEARKFPCRVTAFLGRKKADCKSILELLSLGASFGDELILTFEGADEETAADAFRLLFGKT